MLKGNTVYSERHDYNLLKYVSHYFDGGSSPSSAAILCLSTGLNPSFRVASHPAPSHCAWESSRWCPKCLGLWHSGRPGRRSLVLAAWPSPGCHSLLEGEPSGGRYFTCSLWKCLFNMFLFLKKDLSSNGREFNMQTYLRNEENNKKESRFCVTDKIKLGICKQVATYSLCLWMKLAVQKVFICRILLLNKP